MAALIYSDLVIRGKMAKMEKMVNSKKKNVISPVRMYRIRVRVLLDTPIQYR
jgi:hypothetical protein